MSNLVNPAFRQVAFKGENKVLYKADGTGEFVLSFDSDNSKISIIRSRFSQIVFDLLTECAIPNHFLRAHGQKEQIVTALEMLPFIVNVHTSTNQDMSNRLYCAEGIKLRSSLLELKMRVQGKDYPVISKEHAINFGWITEDDWQKIITSAYRTMDVLYGFFRAYDATITSISLEFGRRYKDGVAQGILLADEMSPKNISLIINDMIGVEEEEIYFEMAKRLGILKYE